MKTNTISEYTKHRLVGMAGEWRVAAELALRGINPYFPGVDIGADLLANGRVRIQVKCAHLTTRQNGPSRKSYPNGAYWFKLWRNAYVTGSTLRQKQRPRDFSKDCDVVVLWGIDEDRFWVVPAGVMDHHSLVVVGPEVQFKRTDGLAQMTGMTHQQMADALGVSRPTVSRRLSGKLAVSKRPLSAQVRSYENRWDLIESMANLGEAANAAAEEQIEVTTQL